MKVHYDHQIFSRQRVGGISQYFSRLIGWYAKSGEPQVSLGFRFYVSEHLSAGRGRLRIPAFRGSGKFCRLLDDMVAAPVRADVVHTTYYDPRYLSRGGRRPKIVTIHDMIPELFPAYFASNPHLAKRSYVEAADRIICVSQQTKQDLVAVYKAPERKIDVIHHGIDVERWRNEVTPIARPRKYFVHIGNRAGYKNFAVVADAMRTLWAADKGTRLLCVGGGRLSAAERERLGPHIQNVLQLDPDDRQVRYLLKHATALIAPSLYEGFGLPIIEAFALDCPVVLARASCFPEIAGDAALYFDPYDAEDLARALSKLLDAEDLRMSLAARGRARVGAFELREMAAKTLEAYQAAM